MKILYVVGAFLIASDTVAGPKVKFEHGATECEVCYQLAKPCAFLDSEIMSLKIIREILFSRTNVNHQQSDIDKFFNYQAIQGIVKNVSGDALVIDRYEFLKEIFWSISYVWKNIWGMEISLFYASPAELETMKVEYAQCKKRYDYICGPIVQTSYQSPDRDEQRRIALRHKQFLLTWVEKINASLHESVKS